MANHVRIGIDLASEIEGQPALYGAKKAIEEDKNIEIVVPGDAAEIKEFCTKQSLDRLIALNTVKKNKGAALRVLTDLSNKQEITAMVTANNTKLVMASVMSRDGIGMCTEEFENPPIIIPLPWITMKDNNYYVTGFSYLLDAGANMRCTPQNLLDFGIMARLYSQHVLGIKEPTIALVNIGEEKNKGRELELETYELLERHFLDKFKGNAEPDPMFSGYADIYVTDGFTGNIILKLGETMVKKLFQFVKKGIYHDTSVIRKQKRKIGGYLLKDMFYELKATFDSASYGGAPMLGLNSCVIKCHGRSNETAFYNAIKNAAQYARADLITKMKEEFSLARAN